MKNLKFSIRILGLALAALSFRFWVMISRAIPVLGVKVDYLHYLDITESARALKHCVKYEGTLIGLVEYCQELDERPEREAAVWAYQLKWYLSHVACDWYLIPPKASI